MGGADAAGVLVRHQGYGPFTGHAAAVKALAKDLREELPSEVQEKTNFYLKDLTPEVADEVWRRFNETLLPLDSAGKLGFVLFQFPPWFGPRSDNRAFILENKERLGQYTMAVEFRNGGVDGGGARTASGRCRSSRRTRSRTSASTSRRGSRAACRR